MKEHTPWVIAIIVMGLVGVAIGAVFTLLGGFSLRENSPRVVVPERTPSAQELVEEGQEEDITSDDAVDETVSLTSEGGEPVDQRTDENWQVIGTYYGHLPYDLTKAYAMRVDQSVSFETFESWYSRVKFAWTRNPVLVGDNAYRFLVNLVEEDPFRLSLYQVVMKVVGGKLETVSAREVNEAVLDTVSRPGYEGDEAQIYYDNGVEYVYRNNGKRTTVTKVDRRRSSEFGGGNLFMEIQKVEFSESGEYLMVSLSGWESGSVEVYDVDRNKKVHTAGSPFDHAFAEDESWFAECQGSGMQEGYVRVYDVPSWDLRYEYPSDGALGDCSIDVERQQIVFSTMVFDVQGAGEEKAWRYDIASNTIVQL